MRANSFFVGVVSAFAIACDSASQPAGDAGSDVSLSETGATDTPRDALDAGVVDTGVDTRPSRPPRPTTPREDASAAPPPDAMRPDAPFMLDDAGLLPIVRVSVNAAGEEANDDSQGSWINGDGTVVAFASLATNLVPGDTNRVSDIFIRELPGTAITRVTGVGGAQPNGLLRSPVISDSGRYIAFTSSASNLVAGDVNGVDDCFVFDRETGTNELISIGYDGSPASGPTSGYPTMSGDGRYVAFSSAASNLVVGDSNGRRDAFVFDRMTRLTIRVSESTGGVEGDNESGLPLISGDGTTVQFVSQASNLAPGDTNGVADIFVHDIVWWETTRGSVRRDGTQIPGGAYEGGSISGDGRFIAFLTNDTMAATGVMSVSSDVVLRDRYTGSNLHVSRNTGTIGQATSPQISRDGLTVLYVASAYGGGPRNAYQDVYVFDARSLEIEIVSAARLPIPATLDHQCQDAALSADGRWTSFTANVPNLVPGDANGKYDVFVAGVPQ